MECPLGFQCQRTMKETEGKGNRCCEPPFENARCLAVLLDSLALNKYVREKKCRKIEMQQPPSPYYARHSLGTFWLFYSFASCTILVAIHNGPIAMWRKEGAGKL